MSMKVGQTAAASAPTRQVAVQNTGPTGLFKEVDALSLSTFVRPEDDSLHYGQDYDELDFQRRRQGGGAETPSGDIPVRFGDILTTEQVSGTLVAYRSSHPLDLAPPIRSGVALYEETMRAIGNAGRLHVAGSHTNWLL